ncbi:hypothetical protein BH11ACT3_BH11ACT3_23100 [soil metagenome]
MANFPKDQFDQIPPDLSRVGAHRAPRKRGRGWIRFAWAALITGVLVVGGLFALSKLVPNINFELPTFGGGGEAVETPSAPPTEAIVAAAPTTVDPIDATAPLSLSVFNGSATENLQNTAGDALVAAGWSDPARANAAQRTEAETVIYYRSAEYAGIAEGIFEQFGVGRIELSDAFPGAPVTIVLGDDYATTTGTGG